MRKLVAALTASLLLLLTLGACANSDSSTASSGQSGALDGVKVTVEDKTKAPKVEITTPVSVTEPAAASKVAGDGADIKEGQQLKVQFALIDPANGSVLQDTYSKDPQTVSMDAFKQDPALYDVLKKSKVGVQVAYAIPGQQTPVDPSASPSARPTTPPSQLMIMQVVEAKDAPGKADQGTVDQLKKDGALPSVDTKDPKKPAFQAPKNPQEIDQLVVDVIEEGDGETITNGATAEVNYAGWTLSDGKQFDSSFERGQAFPVTVGQGQVIKGWDMGLEGLKSGTKAILTIPGDLAYGDNASGGRPAGTLVFYVEIGKVTPPQ